VHRTDKNVQSCIKAVEAWANGTARLSPPEDPLDLPMVPFEQEEGTNLEYPLLEPCSENESNGETDFGNKLACANESSNGLSGDDDIDTESVVSFGDGNNSSGKGSPIQRHTFPACCRGILWLINTQGCRHAVLLSIFDDAGFHPNQYSLSNGQLFNCCDTHFATINTENPARESLARLLPPPNIFEQNQSSGPPAAADNIAERSVQRRSSWEQQAKVRQALHLLRVEIWEDIANGSAFIPYSPYAFFPDSYVEHLAAMCTSIHSQDDVRIQLGNVSQQSAELEPYLHQIFTAVTTNFTHAVAPQPVGQPPRGRNFVQPIHKIAVDVNPTDPKIQRMVAENDNAARVHQELREDEDEIQRDRWSRLDQVATGNQQEKESGINPFAHLIPGSIALPSEGIPDDIYNPRSIPAAVKIHFPVLGHGRPSKASTDFRRTIIRSYWVARGYTGS